MKKLFLLDAYALIYRAYYALIRAPRITSNGFNTSAIFGFCNTLDEILRKENPDYIAVCFDPHGPTFRHKLYPEYKAQREAQPEDISASVPVIKEIIKAYNIAVFEMPGFEADDVIGTIARIAEQEGIRTYMMTPDKDYGQLVTDNILMYKPSMRGQGFELRGPKEVCEKYGISSPAQVIDLLALEGDAIDNIPGCPGVGPKTASKLIGEYGSVENLLAHAPEIKGAIGRKLVEHAENIRFSYKLATICTDVPLTVHFDQLTRRPADLPELKKIFTELEFKSFLARLNSMAQVAAVPAGTPSDKPVPGIPAQPSLFDFMEASEDIEPAAPVKKLGDLRVDYRPLQTEAEIREFVDEALKGKELGMALYAVGAEAMTASLRCAAFSPSEGKAVYIDLPALADDRKGIFNLLRPLFTAPGLTLVSHDIKRDMVLLSREGIELTSPYYDTQLAHYLLQPEMRHKLSDIVMNLLQIQMDDLPDGSSKSAPALRPGKEVSQLGQQADMVLRLRGPLTRLLEQNGQKQLLDDIELPLARVLADMERTGVRIDSSELARMSVGLKAQLRQLEEKVYDYAGEKFNIGSPMQVGEILFGKLHLDSRARKTKTGAYSTTEEVLLKHRASHPIVDAILEVRGVRKLLTTYVDALPEMVNPRTGKIHTTYNQTVTATGRISSANPNLQNIPIRTEEGREVRRAFIADPGCLIMSADYSQIELRLLANLSDDPELTEAFLSGLDIHRATAAKINHIPYEEVTDDQRRAAKTANFGTVYGISAFGLAERLNIPRMEAKALIEGYFQTYPHILEFIEKSKEDARKAGFVSTIMGRKRYLPDINSRNATVRSFAERNAVNAPLQGSAADIIKIAMIRISDEIKRLGLKSRMIMQVHDELVFNVPREELDQMRELVQRLMSGAYSGKVPLDVSAGTGTNWLEAH